MDHTDLIGLGDQYSESKKALYRLALVCNGWAALATAFKHRSINLANKGAIGTLLDSQSESETYSP